MDEFTEIFQRATEAIAPDYFHLPVHHAAALYRERVYCYELYHQMRLRWPGNSPYRLNGEVDKRNHPDFEGEPKKKPDFIVHQPGTAENCVVMEVKAAGIAAREATKDLRTLALFTELARYRRPIYLIYGVRAGDDVATAQRCLRDFRYDLPLELWIHEAPGTPAVRA